jgi:hypothetical protein
MTIINKLSSQQGLKGNEANVTLAAELVKSKNKKAIKELVDNLAHQDKKIQSDCIKVLYETGYINPELIADYHREFLELLVSKNNRLVWGAMVALASMTDFRHNEIYESFDLIKKTIENGSVITVDCGIEILAKLNKHQEYSEKAEPVLTDLLWNCPIKQLPQYLEKSLVCVNKGNKEIYENIIRTRKTECEKESQVKRLNKVLRQIEKMN